MVYSVGGIFLIPKWQFMYQIEGGGGGGGGGTNFLTL